MTRWTQQETSLAFRLLDRGQTYQQVAATLGRTAGSVQRHTTRRNPLDTSLLTATSVAYMLGVAPSTVGKLMARKLIVAQRRNYRGRAFIARRAVEDFVRYYSEHYDARKIRDPKLAAIASAPAVLSHKLMTYSEAANELGLSRNRVNELVIEGVLPGSKVENSYRSYVPRDQVALLKHYRYNWLTAKAAATRLGYTFKSVENMCRKCKLRAIKIGGAWYIDPQSVAAYKPRKSMERA